jgi:hypothetical protein
MTNRREDNVSPCGLLFLLDRYYSANPYRAIRPVLFFKEIHSMETGIFPMHADLSTIKKAATFATAFFETTIAKMG